MLELIFMIITMLTIMGAPIIVPMIVYEISGNEEVSDMIQILMVILDMVAIYLWLVFFAL